MSFSDPLGDLLTRIRNGQRARKAVVQAPFSTLRMSALAALQREGYIRTFEKVEDGNKANITVELKYHNGEPVIETIKRVSRPGRRVYSSIDDLKRVRNGLGVSVLSTPKGVMSDNEARAERVGGEVLFQVY
ncbi:MAG: 30S ribosomal protein S8 [Sneathiellaceae bacterium]